MSDALHPHPNNAKETVLGRRRQPREELGKGDVYNRPDGKWVEVPDAFVGVVLPGKHVTIFIRPANRIVELVGTGKLGTFETY